jgi:hypothetical protein
MAMKGSPGYRFSKEELDWIAAHPDEVVGWARGDRIIVWTLVVTFLLGLAVNLIGFSLASGALALPGGWPTDLVADLLVNVGVVLWTSVVLVVFLEILPTRQQRQARAWARSALVALRQRGDELPPEVLEAADEPAEDSDAVREVGAKLDAILARLDAIESAIGAQPRSDAASP